MAAYDEDGGLLDESSSSPFELATDETTSRLGRIVLTYQDADGPITVTASGTTWERSVTGIDGTYTITIDETTDADIWDADPLVLTATATGTDGTTSSSSITIDRTIPAPIVYGAYVASMMASSASSVLIGSATGTESSPVSAISIDETTAGGRLASIGVTYGGTQHGPMTVTAIAVRSGAMVPGWEPTLQRSSQNPQYFSLPFTSSTAAPVYSLADFDLVLTATDGTQTWTSTISVTREIPVSMWIRSVYAYDGDGIDIGSATGGTEARPVSNISIDEDGSTGGGRLARLEVVFGGNPKLSSPTVTASATGYAWSKVLTPYQSGQFPLTYELYLDPTTDADIYDVAQLELRFSIADTGQTLTKYMTLTRAIPSSKIEAVEIYEGVDVPDLNPDEAVMISAGTGETTLTSAKTFAIHFAQGIEPAAKSGEGRISYSIMDEGGTPTVGATSLEYAFIDPPGASAWYISLDQKVSDITEIAMTVTWTPDGAPVQESEQITITTPLS